MALNIISNNLSSISIYFDVYLFKYLAHFKSQFLFVYPLLSCPRLLLYWIATPYKGEAFGICFVPLCRLSLHSVWFVSHFCEEVVWFGIILCIFFCLYCPCLWYDIGNKKKLPILVTWNNSSRVSSSSLNFRFYI